MIEEACRADNSLAKQTCWEFQVPIALMWLTLAPDQGLDCVSYLDHERWGDSTTLENALWKCSQIIYGHFSKDIFTFSDHLGWSLSSFWWNGAPGNACLSQILGWNFKFSFTRWLCDCLSSFMQLLFVAYWQMCRPVLPSYCQKEGKCSVLNMERELLLSTDRTGF